MTGLRRFSPGEKHTHLVYDYADLDGLENDRK